MAITTPTAFVPIAYNETGTNRPIDDTELTLARNTHYLYGRHRPTLVRTTFRTDSDVSSGQQPYVVGRPSTSVEVNAMWCVEPPGPPFLKYAIYALVENTSSTDAGILRFDLASDPHPGTFVDVVLRPGLAQWTQVIGLLDIDNSQTTDTIQMSVINGASGECRVHHVLIVPHNISSIAAAPSTVNNHTFVPIDDDELGQDSPLSVRLRHRVHGNMYHVWRNRPGSCVGFSDDTHYRVGAQAFTTTESEYVEVTRFPIFIPKDVTEVRWAVFARKTGSGVGKVRLRTASMDLFGTAPIEIDAVQSWSSPYQSNLIKYNDTGYTTLTVTGKPDAETTQDEIIIDLKSDGAARVDLLGITAWFRAVST